MRNLLHSVIVLLLMIFSSCQRNEDSLIQPQASGEILRQKAQQIAVPAEDVISRSELDKRIIKRLEESGDFRWSNAGLLEMVSAVQYQPLVAIGYKPADMEQTEAHLHEINIRSEEWKAVRNAIVQFVLNKLNEKNATKLSEADIIEEEDEVLPILILRLQDREIITALYNLKNTRYIEPYGYWPETAMDRSSSGCSGSTYAVSTSDWTAELPACKVPWNFHTTNIPEAWTMSTGEGVKIGIIDAGLSSSQSFLGSQFRSGYSNNNRTITTDWTYGSGAYTSCTHGTSMSGLAVGPRNDQNASTGIAYRSSLHFIRGCSDVVLDESKELSGVKNALTRMGNMSDVKIISMSIGTPFYSSALNDGVVYAYNKGKLIFAAAGTSFSWTSWYGVIYPAALTQCVAVTGVKENYATCSSCHDGSQVEFTVVMERSSNSSRNSLSLAPSGSNPSYIGGSSCATAMAAGVAGLVWSANPSLSRTDVYNCLRNTSQYYPSRNSSRGYGNINAGAAVNYARGL